MDFGFACMQGNSILCSSRGFELREADIPSIAALKAKWMLLGDSSNWDLQYAGKEYCHKTPPCWCCWTSMYNCCHVSCYCFGRWRLPSYFLCCYRGATLKQGYLPHFFAHSVNLLAWLSVFVHCDDLIFLNVFLYCLLSISGSKLFSLPYLDFSSFFGISIVKNVKYWDRLITYMTCKSQCVSEIVLHVYAHQLHSHLHL